MPPKYEFWEQVQKNVFVALQKVPVLGSDQNKAEEPLFQDEFDQGNVNFASSNTKNCT